MEYLLDVNFDQPSTITPTVAEQAQLAQQPTSFITPSAEEQAQLVSSVAEPVSSITPTPEEQAQLAPTPPLVSSITPTPEEQAELVASLTPPPEQPVSPITPTPQEQAELVSSLTPTLEQQTNLSNLTTASGWNPWALAASGSRGGNWGDRMRLGLDVTNLGTSALDVSARGSQVLDPEVLAKGPGGMKIVEGVGAGTSVLTLGDDLSQLGNGLNLLSEGDATGLGDAAQGGSSATATGLDLLALATDSAKVGKGANLAGAVAIGVEGVVETGQGLHDGDKEQIALGTLKQAAATGIVTGVATGNPVLIGGGLAVYGGTVYWENRETINPIVADSYRVVDSIPTWVLPFTPQPVSTGIFVVQNADDFVGAGKALVNSLPKVRIRKPF